jgi:3-isopropylmalate dehydratase small subunit
LSYRLGFADIDIDKIMPKKYMTDQDNEEDSDQDNNKEDKDSNKEDTE